MAIIDSFTLYSQFVSYFGSNYGFRSTGNTPSMGNINSSSIQYSVSNNWYSNASVNTFYTYNTTLYLDLDGTVSNSGWQDIRVDGTTFNRTSASYSSSIGRWNWNNITVPFGTNTYHDIIVTDDGTTTETGVIIPLGITSGAIDMNSLRNFFGEPNYNSSTIAMNNLYRGGDLVPDIGGNGSIPTSGTISLSNLYGANTTLVIDKHPVQKVTFAGFGQTGTASVVWNQSILANGEGDVDIGYKLLKSVLEYRWVINVTSTSGSISGLSRIIASGVTSYMSGSSHTTAWGDTMTLILEVDHGLSTGDINGTVYMEARQVWNGSTYSVTTNQAFWGITVESAGE